MTNTEELIKIIKKSGYKKSYIAQKLGITTYSLQKKVENKTEFKASEIVLLSKILDIKTSSERDHIFLNKNVILNQQYQDEAKSN